MNKIYNVSIRSVQKVDIVKRGNFSAVHMNVISTLMFKVLLQLNKLSSDTQDLLDELGYSI